MWGNQGGYEQQGGYGGDQGGGYMNSPGQFGSPQMSQEKKRQRAQNILPCTVAQVLSAEQQDDRFIVGGVELHQVTLVGLVRTVKEAATRLDYEVDDMTGPPLEVRQFVDNDENSPDEERTVPMRENTYVRVFGHVRAFNQKRSVVAFRLVPLMDMNELTTHLLEVVHSHLTLTKQQAALPVQELKFTLLDTLTTSDQDFHNSPGLSELTLKQQDAAGQSSTADHSDTMDTTAPGGYGGAQGDGMNGLTPTQQQVSLVIKGCTDEQGVNVNFITQKLRGIPQKAIMEAIEFLSSEGHIYSTIDDEHYKSTDSM